MISPENRRVLLAKLAGRDQCISLLKEKLVKADIDNTLILLQRLFDRSEGDFVNLLASLKLLELVEEVWLIE